MGLERKIYSNDTCYYENQGLPKKAGVSMAIHSRVLLNEQTIVVSSETFQRNGEGMDYDKA